MKGPSDKISMYADDILIFLENPILQLSHIMEVINKFSDIYGYKVN